MVILRTADPNTIEVDARLHVPGTYTLSVNKENENQRTTSTLSNVSYLNGIVSFSHNFAASEGQFYYCQLFNDDILIARFKAFGTDSTDLQNYSINGTRFNTVADHIGEFKTA